MKRLLAIIVSLMLLLCACTGAPAIESADSSSASETDATETEDGDTSEPLNIDIRFGTSSSGGTWYTLGMGLATLWNDKLEDKGINVFAQATGGGQENAQMLAADEIEMCFLGGLLATYTYNGQNEFPQNTDMRALTAMQEGGIQWIIMADDAKTGTYKDIEGMRFALNNPGASAGLNYEVVKAALGDLHITEEYLNPSAAAEAMKMARYAAAHLTAVHLPLLHWICSPP